MTKKRKAKKFTTEESAFGAGNFTPRYKQTKTGFDPVKIAIQMGEYYDAPPPKRDPAVGRLNEWAKKVIKKREKNERLTPDIRNRDDNF